MGGGEWCKGHGKSKKGRTEGGVVESEKTSRPLEKEQPTCSREGKKLRGKRTTKRARRGAATKGAAQREKNKYSRKLDNWR